MQIQNYKKLGPSSGFRDINIRRKIPNFVDTFAQICGARGERTYLGLSMYRNQCIIREIISWSRILAFSPLIAALIESRHMSSRSKGSYLQLMEKQNWTVCCFQARAPAPFVAIKTALHPKYQISHCQCNSRQSVAISNITLSSHMFTIEKDLDWELSFLNTPRHGLKHVFVF